MMPLWSSIAIHFKDTMTTVANDSVDGGALLLDLRVPLPSSPTHDIHQTLALKQTVQPLPPQEATRVLIGERGGAVVPELEAFLDREAGARLQSRVCWKYLETCFKWRLIQVYLHEAGVDDNDPRVGQVRALLSQRQLPAVVYDSSARRVVRLNHIDL